LNIPDAVTVDWVLEAADTLLRSMRYARSCAT